MIEQTCAAGERHRIGLAFGPGIATQAHAQAYPDKPIKMIVPFPPGGPIDTMARLDRRSDHQHALGQQVIVENRPGAGATIGAKAVAAADARRLHAAVRLVRLARRSRRRSIQASTSTRSSISRRSRPRRCCRMSWWSARTCRPRRSRSSSPTPRPIRASSTTAQASARRRICSSALFKTQAGIDVTYIPYKGTAPSVTDLLGGQTHFTIDGC